MNGKTQGRMTEKLSGMSSYVLGEAFVSKADGDGYAGKAVEKLACLENLICDIEKQQIEIAEQLEVLRNEDKVKSVKFKELMVKKLNNVNMVSLFKSYKII